MNSSFAVPSAKLLDTATRRQNFQLDSQLGKHTLDRLSSTFENSSQTNIPEQNQGYNNVTSS